MAPPNILDRALPAKPKSDVSLSAFAFLFSEIVQYSQTRVDSSNGLERKLEDMGYPVGQRMLELTCSREKGNKRETKIINILSFISSTLWKTLFGKAADSLEKGATNEDEYMIRESEPLVNKFIAAQQNFNCAAFVAGIIKGVLDGAEFPAEVSTFSVQENGQRIPRTVFLIKFDQQVLEREKRAS
eukprot:tig00020961_g16720.t1